MKIFQTPAGTLRLNFTRMALFAAGASLVWLGTGGSLPLIYLGLGLTQMQIEWREPRRRRRLG